MKIYQDISNFHVKNPVITIGSFDGVHLGHLKIINRLKDIAHQSRGETVVFTFSPHPRQVLFPEERNLRLLTTLEEKKELFEKAGIEHLILFPFTREFSQLSYTDFVRDILVGKLSVSILVVGHDHKFGKNREGDFDVLKNLSLRYNFSVEQLDALLMDDINISSTKIRNALQYGKIEKAGQFLGYPFMLHGTVIEGQRLGRRIQFPTANIEASDPNKIIPAYGVYAVYVKIGDDRYRGMLNIGTRPTVSKNADHRSIEVHILDFDGDLYKKQIGVEFIKKIRDEQKFNSIEELKHQLEKDKQTVLNILG